MGSELLRAEEGATRSRSNGRSPSIRLPLLLFSACTMPERPCTENSHHIGVIAAEVGTLNTKDDRELRQGIAHSILANPAYGKAEHALAFSRFI